MSAQPAQAAQAAPPSSLDLAVAWFNQFALQYAVLGATFTAILAVSFVMMTLFSTGAVYKRARYLWLVWAVFGQIAAAILNSMDARRLGLHENIPDKLFTAQIAMLFTVPLYADVALLPRIKELTRQKGKTILQDKRTILAVAIPTLLKVPRILLIIDFLSMKDTCVPLTKTSPLASVLMCMPAQKFALLEWSFALADQATTMVILAICMHHLGWGWGDKRAVSKSIVGKFRMFCSSLAATMTIPVLVLTALLALHASGKKTHIEGYLMALQPAISVLGAALAALYPLVRTDRRAQLARVKMQASQTEARRLSMMEFEAADPFTTLGKGMPPRTLLDAPHLRPNGMPTLKRHSSHSGYLNSTTYSHFTTSSDGGAIGPHDPNPQDTYTIMNVKVMKPNRDLNVPNWTITTRQRSPHSEAGSDDGMDEKLSPNESRTGIMMPPGFKSNNSSHSNLTTVAPQTPTTPTRPNSYASAMMPPGGRPLGTPVSPVHQDLNNGNFASPVYRGSPMRHG
ncbi:hypothetical protein OC846_003391 [Tilletia horrida]|uniref:Uncharacterized protein n=1 Tax=Tilletia horrida TaxID=155126 RepID=A0AAN6JRC8_9BASI|nr:hypothetical protein OC845_003216 [Tilletia horrida]KAK0551151.1 hypothetical protein OC846_003391 [Tilletia horrida]KAK0566116.1 hypothetical protein OC861_003410 [Tilletia horrida]